MLSNDSLGQSSLHQRQKKNRQLETMIQIIRTNRTKDPGTRTPHTPKQSINEINGTFFYNRSIVVSFSISQTLQKWTLV